MPCYGYHGSAGFQFGEAKTVIRESHFQTESAAIEIDGGLHVVLHRELYRRIASTLFANVSLTAKTPFRSQTSLRFPRGLSSTIYTE